MSTHPLDLYKLDVPWKPKHSGEKPCPNGCPNGMQSSKPITFYRPWYCSACGKVQLEYVGPGHAR